VAGRITVVSSPKAYKQAIKNREVFYGKSVSRAEELQIEWPEVVKRVGRTNAMIYFSDKMLNGGVPEVYKHIAESPGDVFVNDEITTMLNNYGQPIRFVTEDDPEGRRELFRKNRRRYRRNFTSDVPEVITTQEFRIEGPMPKEISVLAENRGLQVFLPTGQYLEMRLPRTKWAAAVHPVSKEVFLLCYGEEGVHFLLTGDELDITKDGVVG
jgi:hypothetical protein